MVWFNNLVVDARLVHVAVHINVWADLLDDLSFKAHHPWQAVELINLEQLIGSKMSLVDFGHKRNITVFCMKHLILWKPAFELEAHIPATEWGNAQNNRQAGFGSLFGAYVGIKLSGSVTDRHAGSLMNPALLN